MESNGGHVIIADDDPEFLRRYVSALSRGSARAAQAGTPQVTAVRTGPDVVQLVRISPIDLVLAEETMSPMGGLEILDAVKRANPSTLVILLTRRPTVESVIAA